MDSELLRVTEENLAAESLCCIVRMKKTHPGIEAKRAWLAERIPEGHVFLKLRGDGCAFIEYAPLETAWVPIVGGEVRLFILPVGAGRAEGARLRAQADGSLHRRREGVRAFRRVHARQSEAEGVAVRISASRKSLASARWIPPGNMCCWR